MYILYMSRYIYIFRTRFFTDRSIEDLPALRLLLADGGEGPFRRLVVLFITGLTLNKHTQLLKKLKISCFIVNQEYKRSLQTTTVIGLPVRVFRAAVAVALLLPPSVPVDQLAEVGRLLTVFDDELVFEELLGRRTLKRRE